jgi:oligopeptide transport system ATP-binding protein
LYKGQDLLRLSDRRMREIRGREIAMIFQDPMTSLNPVLKIGRQIVESLRLHLDYGEKEARARAVELLDLVGIPNPEQRMEDYPHQFSGGQRQRVIIAIALSCNPSLLIADEPTTALDVTIQAQIISLVKRLKEQLGMAVIWITHDMGVIAGLVDDVAVMYGGLIVEEAPVRALYKRPTHPYTLGLLHSIPRIDAALRVRLEPINGLPPDMLAEPKGCSFAPRCDFVVEQCRHENPPPIPVGSYHRAACWEWETVRNRKGVRETS